VPPNGSGPLHPELTDDLPVKPATTSLLDVLCAPDECASEFDAFAPQAAPTPPDGTLPVDLWVPPACNPDTNAATKQCRRKLQTCLAENAFSSCETDILIGGQPLGKTLVGAVEEDRDELAVLAKTQPGQSYRIDLRNEFLDALKSPFVDAGHLRSMADKITTDNDVNSARISEARKKLQENLKRVIECWKGELAKTPRSHACDCYNQHGSCWRAAGCSDSLPKVDKDHCFYYMACTRAQCEGSGAAGATVAAAALLVTAAATAALAVGRQ
jgi:hypothetical protein